MKPALIMLLALLVTPVLTAAAPPRLVPDVSQRRIDIESGFTGEQLLLFGAIVYPGGRPPADGIDIAVVVKGPAEAITVREKRQIAGVWVNADSSIFRSAPAYYAVASSRPISQIVNEKTAAIYELGLDKLQLSPAGSFDGAEVARFTTGLVDLRRRAGLYREAEDPVEISENTLYRARLPLPASVPVGTYTAETFLIEDGRVVAAASRDISIGKTGFEQFITLMADRYGFFYGLFAVAISLGFGWVAGQVASRRR